MKKPEPKSTNSSNSTKGMKDAHAARQGLTLPPYGQMHQDFQRSIDLDIVPEGFRVDGRAAQAHDYDAFIEQETRAIAEVLWPRYDAQQGAWKGTAAQQALALTRADLELMTELRQHLGDEVVVPAVLRNGETVRPAQRLGKNQRALFELEDTSARGTIDLYLATVKVQEAPLLDAVKASVSVGFARLGPTTLRFKQEFQRPRPYQAALMLGMTPFAYEYGATAVTPALVSGHCMQGLFVRTWATLQHRRELERHLGAVDAMRRYCIEIGDRRVFAGVHYPSDNLSSWYGCLRLCHHSFDRCGQEAKDFMWQAIQESQVFATMKKAAAHQHPIYRTLLQWLETEARRKVG